MESSNCLPNSKTSTYTGRRTIAGSSVVFPQILPSCSESSLVGLKASAESTEVSGHQPPRWASDFFIEEQPFWLDDLLNEPDGLMQRGHRRSTSDTFAYLGEAVEDLDLREEPSHRNLTSKALSIRQNIGRNKDSKLFESKPSSLVEKLRFTKMDPHIAVSRSAEKQEEEISTQTSEGSNEGISSLSPKPSVSKTEAKRAKQQSAHRSRVRKLQYISQLERTVQLLQAEGSEISAELEFLDHQNLILTMENKALKQRLDSLSQEQLIKQMEQEMLERELGRLQNLYHMQRQQQMQMQQQQQQHHPKHRRNKSKDLESQLPSVSRKNVRGNLGF
nr:basic leucine zipper 34-like [Coffea arabica]